MSVEVEYEFLESRPRSNYRQLWVKGRHMRAEVLYRCTVGEEPQTVEEVAREYDVPTKAVLEAVDYCTRNKQLLDAERARENSSIRARGLDCHPYAPVDYKPEK
jgi:hypothetical protein